MELSWLLFQNIIILLVMVLMGFVTVRNGKLKSEQSTVLSALCINWLTPCAIINSFQTEYSADKAEGLLLAAIAAVVMMLVFILITMLIRRPLRLTVVEQGTLVYTNAANLALPLVAAVVGPEGVFYCSAYMSLQNIFIWTHLYSIMGREDKKDWKKILLNRNIISVIIGILLFAFRIPLPKILKDTISSVGGVLGPVSMFMIGMLMGDVDFRQVLSKGRIYLVSLGRLLFYPVLGILLIRLTGITHILSYAKDVLLITTIGFCSPSAALVVQQANLYRTTEEAKDAGSLNVLTTIACVLTMPLIVAIYQWIC